MAAPEIYLLVEGKNDQHVIWALCARHELPDTFSVETPEDAEGIGAVLAGLQIRLVTPYIPKRKLWYKKSSKRS
jgi:hypothetical protein